MTQSLVLVTLLCFTTWMSSVHATNGRAKDCCFPTITRVHPKKIVSYTIQSDSPCPVTAIVFRTKMNKTICSSPQSDWAQRVMMKLNGDTKDLLERRQNQEGSASGNTTPAITISSKNTPPRNGRNGKRRQRKREGKKVHRKRA